MGKSLEYTESEVLEAIKGCSGVVTNVSEKLKCSWNSAQKYINEYESCIQAFKDEGEHLLDTAENKLKEAIEGGDMQMVRYLLSTKGKKRGYTEKQEVELTGEKLIYLEKQDEGL